MIWRKFHIKEERKHKRDIYVKAHESV